MSHRTWTRDEDARLLAGIAQHKTHACIAAELDRPISSIGSRLHNLGTSTRALRAAELIADERPTSGLVGRRAMVKQGGPGERRPRKCLCCGNEFASAHAGNRLCSTCRRTSVSPYAPAL